MNALILATDILEKLILGVLFGLSVWSVSIMVDRYRLFKHELNREFFINFQSQLIQIKDKSQLIKLAATEVFIHRVFKKALEQSSDSDTFERALSGVLKNERVKFEKGLAVLATLGANAPFIGLFGTVLGIIRAFAYLGTQSGSSAVMSGVSQALYATALGLLVAIPAVVANNYFSFRWRQSLQMCEAIRDEVMARQIVSVK